MDEAAAIIRGYLAHPSCSLQTLSLRSADVDDNECCYLMEAISRNQSLTRLDISGNISRHICCVQLWAVAAGRAGEGSEVGRTAASVPFGWIERLA